MSCLKRMTGTYQRWLSDSQVQSLPARPSLPSLRRLQPHQRPAVTERAQRWHSSHSSHTVHRWMNGSDEQWQLWGVWGGGGQLSQGKECVGTLERNVLQRSINITYLVVTSAALSETEKWVKSCTKSYGKQNRQHGVSSHVEKEWTSTLCCAWNGAVLSLHYHCAVWLKVTR